MRGRMAVFGRNLSDLASVQAGQADRRRCVLVGA